MVVPSGTRANVSIIPPDKPSPEDIEGVPKLSTYEELRNTLEIRKYEFWTYSANMCKRYRSASKHHLGVFFVEIK